MKVSEFLSLLEAEGEKEEKGTGLGMEAYGVSGATVAPELDVGEVGTDEYIYVDPSDRKNVMSWMICRDLVRTYGQSFMLRGEAYLSVNLLASMFILAGINVLIVGGVEHHWWDVVQLMFYMLVLTRTVVATALSVAELNELVIEHREIIRAAKVRMCGGGDGSGGGSAEDVRQSVMFLNVVDELIETREQTANPHKIFGIPATKQVVQSYLGIIGSGLFFAAQTFITSSSGYGADGMYVAGVAG